MKKVLIIHNIAWSHYKAIVFSQLNLQCTAEDHELFVIHMAASEAKRGMTDDRSKLLHAYPHSVIWPGYIEQLPLYKKLLSIAKALIEHRPDIVIVSGYYEVAYIATIIATKLFRRKLIIAVDSTEFDKPRRAPIEFVKRGILWFADGIFGYGTKSRDYCVKLGVAAERIFIRCQATDIRFIAEKHEKAKARISPTRDRAFAYVGRLSDEKNAQLAVEAFLAAERQLGPALENWRMKVIGDGPLKGAIQELVRSSGSKRVDFVDGVSWDKVPDQLADVDVLILPSKSEAWGLVVNEAMCCGKAVIVSDRCGCVPDIVEHGKTGFIFNLSSPTDLCTYMTRFATEDALASQMGQAGKKLISEYSPEKAAHQMLIGIKWVLKN